jgi:hypothetical protein
VGSIRNNIAGTEHPEEVFLPLAVFDSGIDEAVGDEAFERIP